MEGESNPMRALCRSGCGFFSNPSTDGLCSLCYKEALKKKQQPPNPAPSAVSGNATLAFQGDGAVSLSPPKDAEAIKCQGAGAVETGLPTVTVASVADLIDENAGDLGAAGGENSANADGKDSKDLNKDAKKKNRCASCRKKVGLTGFDCRCGGLYCAVHRYSDKHSCTFNYRETGAQEIRRNNPVIISEKIKKI